MSDVGLCAVKQGEQQGYCEEDSGEQAKGAPTDGDQSIEGHTAFCGLLAVHELLLRELKDLHSNQGRGRGDVRKRLGRFEFVENLLMRELSVVTHIHIPQPKQEQKNGRNEEFLGFNERHRVKPGKITAVTVPPS